MPLRRSGAGAPRLALALALAAARVRCEPRAAVQPLPPGAEPALPPRPELQLLGHAPVARAGGGGAGGGLGQRKAAGGGEERVFLDVSLCFNRSVELVAVDFFVADVAPLHAGAFRWRVLDPIPSRGEAATQWFRLQEAWPLPPAGAAAEAAFPAPGAYRSWLEPPLRLGFGYCIGWSVAGGGDGPLAFEPGGAAEVAWARSSGGLHDAVELFVKRGSDPTTAQQRAAPHIGWTGLERRTYSVRLLYVPQAEPPPRQMATVAAPSSAPVVEGGNPACWRDGFSFEACCGGSGRPPDNTCWDTFFTYERCCTLTSVKRFMDLNFSAASTVPHYELLHLQRDNPPRLGPVQDDEALLLFALARATRPRTIVEFGTANGFSGLNWMHAIADDPEALVFSYDILPYPAGLQLEDSDPRFVFVQKSQADFDPRDVYNRPVDIAFFDAGHLVEYSLKAFERVLPALSPSAIVAVHDTGLHVLDHGAGAPAEEEGLPFSEERCAVREGGSERCHRFTGCRGEADARGHCVGRAHRPSERQFVREVLRRWREFRPLHVHSRRVFRHGLTLLQRGELWDSDEAPSGDF